MNRFLNGKEITTAIFCHNKIIMTYKRPQYRNLFSYSIHCQTSNSTRPIYIQVRIILTPFRTSCTHTFRNPHEQFFWSLRPHLLHQIMRYLVHIHKRHIQLFCHITRRLQIFSMSINQHFSILRNTPLWQILAHIIFGYRIFIIPEITTDNGIEQHGNSPFSTCFFYKTA